jgi:hypothetical protein
MTSAARVVGDRVDDLPRISPELVLVDPELSRRVRPRVPILSRRRRRPPLPSLGPRPAGSGDPAQPGLATPVGS